MSNQIIIRNLPDSLKPGLRRRAAEHGRSVEAEARSILLDAVEEIDPVLGWLDDIVPSADHRADEPGLPVPERTGGRGPVAFE